MGAVEWAEKATPAAVKTATAAEEEREIGAVLRPEGRRPGWLLGSTVTMPPAITIIIRTSRAPDSVRLYGVPFIL
nr:hypothetical protein Iba_chr04cCG2960 [Ipomoea batatas]